MRSALSLSILSFVFAAPAVGQPAITPVELSNFKFAPAQVDLRANVPIVLRLHNASSGGHSFSAPSFFAAATLDPASARLIHEGKIEIPAHATVEVALTPATGRYPLKCSHLLHSSFGMKGTISVQ
jgi:plastocyanin